MTAKQLKKLADFVDIKVKRGDGLVFRMKTIKELEKKYKVKITTTHTSWKPKKLTLADEKLGEEEIMRLVGNVVRNGKRNTLTKIIIEVSY